jgi:uncharacterized coiled-coil protein SlyX
MGEHGNGFWRHPIVSALAVAIIVGGAGYFANQGANNERLARVEKDAAENRSNIADLVHSLNENTSATKVLAERMNSIIRRMDERAAERRRSEGERP